MQVKPEREELKNVKEYTFDIAPMSQVKVPRKGHPDTQRHVLFKKYKDKIRSIAKAKGFKPSGALKMIFIIPIPSKYSPMEQMRLKGEPHQTKGYPLYKLVKPIREALLGEDDADGRLDPFRIDASKYWGTSGKIIVKHIVVEDFDSLKQRI